jgi:hypothetical protein
MPVYSRIANPESRQKAVRAVITMNQTRRDAVNGMPRLPRELRDMVYEEVVGPVPVRRYNYQGDGAIRIGWLDPRGEFMSDCYGESNNIHQTTSPRIPLLLASL